MRLLRASLYTVVALSLLAAALRVIRTGDWADAATWAIVAAFAGYSAMLDRRVDRSTREGTARASIAYARGYRDGLKHDADTLDQE